MPGHTSKVNDAINRVKCVVDSCYYHSGNNQCMAEKIEIQPPNAASSQDTDCATFMPKSHA